MAERDRPNTTDSRVYAGIGAFLRRCRVPIACLALLGTAFGLVACGSDEPTESTKTAATPHFFSGFPRGEEIPKIGWESAKPIPTRMVAVPWRVVRVRGPRAVEISSEEGYCVGSEPPKRYLAVTTQKRGSRVFIAPYVSERRPAANGPVVCNGVGFFQTGTVHLEQPLGDVQLFVDATTSPPAQRWPETAN